MGARQVIAADSPYRRDVEEASLNPRILSVVLHLRARYGAVRILGIGRGVQPLCHDLRHSGYQVATIEPGENSEAGRCCPPFLEAGSIDGAVFDMAISIESDTSPNIPAALVAIAANHLAPNGVFVLSVPYGGYLKNLLISLYEGWQLPFFAASDSNYLQRWSRKSLTTLLESQGFSVVEFIGVRGASLQWESLILLAKKTGQPTRTNPQCTSDSPRYL